MLTATSGTMNLNVELLGFTALDRKVKGALEQDGFIAVPFSQAMEAIGVVEEQGAISTAPLDRGGTIARMSHKVQKAPLPRYVIIKTAARRGRYSYPRFTNYASSSSRMRPLTKAGVMRRTRPNQNKGWFQRGLNRVWSAVPAIMERAAKQVEQRWSEHTGGIG